MKKSIIFSLATIFITTHANTSDRVTDQELREALRAIYPNEMTPEPVEEGQVESTVVADVLPMQGVSFGDNGLEQAYLSSNIFLRLQGYPLGGRLEHYLKAHPSIDILFLADCGPLTEMDIRSITGLTNLQALKLANCPLEGDLLKALVDVLPKDLTILDLSGIKPNREALDYLLSSKKFILSKLRLQLALGGCEVTNADIEGLETSVLGLAESIYLGPHFSKRKSYDAFYSKMPGSAEVYLIDQPLEHGFFWCKQKLDDRSMWILQDSRPSSSRTDDEPSTTVEQSSLEDSGSGLEMLLVQANQMIAAQEAQFRKNQAELEASGVPVDVLRSKLQAIASSQEEQSASPATVSPVLQFCIDPNNRSEEEVSISWDSDE